MLPGMLLSTPVMKIRAALSVKFTGLPESVHVGPYQVGDPLSGG